MKFIKNLTALFCLGPLVLFGYIYGMVVNSLKIGKMVADIKFRLAWETACNKVTKL